MMPGYWPGASGQTAKLGHGPYLVVTTTSCSIIAGILNLGQRRGAASRDCRTLSRSFADRSAQGSQQTEGVGKPVSGLAKPSPQPGHAMQIGEPAVDKGDRVGELGRAVLKPIQGCG